LHYITKYIFVIQISQSTFWGRGNTDKQRLYLLAEYGRIPFMHFTFFSLQFSNNVVIYSNSLIYAVHDPVNHFIVWEYRFKVKVECDMSKNEKIGNQVSNGHINNTQYSKPAVGSGHFAIQMRFFNDSKYQFELNGNELSYFIGDNIYVKVQTSLHDYDVKMRLSDCYTKPSRQASDRYIYYLVKDG